MRPIPKPDAAPLAALLVAVLLTGPGPAAQAGEAVRGRAVKPAARAPARTAESDDAGARLSRIEQAMWNRDPKALPRLREWAAKDPDDRVRERSVGALALLGDAQATPVFLGLLAGDPAAAVRRAAAEAIGLLRSAVDVRRLADALQKDRDPFVRAECARAMGRLGGSAAAAPLLVSVVQDPSPEVRALAAAALSGLRSPAAADVLGAVAVRDDAVLVRIYAVRTLADISPGPSASLFRTVWEGTSDADLRLEAFRGLLLAEGGDAWERLGLSDADERVRFLAFRSWLGRAREAHARDFGARPDPDLEARLETFLADRVRGIRELAREQLESLGVRVRPSGFGYTVER